MFVQNCIYIAVNEQIEHGTNIFIVLAEEWAIFYVNWDFFSWQYDFKHWSNDANTYKILFIAISSTFKRTRRFFFVWALKCFKNFNLFSQMHFTSFASDMLKQKSNWRK